MAKYDIKQVTRYVLVRKPATEYAGSDMDVAEFKRHDEAERVLASLRAMSPEDAAKDAGFRGWAYNSPAMSLVNDDGSVSLIGRNGKEILALAPGSAIRNVGGKLAVEPA